MEEAELPETPESNKSFKSLIDAIEKGDVSNVKKEIEDLITVIKKSGTAPEGTTDRTNQTQIKNLINALKKAFSGLGGVEKKLEKDLTTINNTEKNAVAQIAASILVNGKLKAVLKSQME